MAKTPELKLTNDYQKNYIINGDFPITQRGTSFNSPASGTYTADRWVCEKVGAGTVITSFASSDLPTLAQSGFQSSNALNDYVLSPVVSLPVSDIYSQAYRMEGFDYLQIHGEKNLTLSFWVKATVIGPYSICLRNNGSNIRKVLTYTVDSSNTWEKKSITFKSHNAGVWSIDNGIGLRINFIYAAGTSVLTPNINVWEGGSLVAATGQVNNMSANGNVFKLSQVQLTEGTEALPFRRASKNIQDELAMCKRYYERLHTTNNAGITIAQAFTATTGEGFLHFSVEKRAIPQVTFSANWAIWGGTGFQTFTPVAQEIQTQKFTMSYTISAMGGTGSCHQIFANGGDAYIEVNAEL